MEDKLLSVFAGKLKALHEPLVLGLYITGSMALRDFQPTKSDVDFLVLCDTLPTKTQLGAVRMIHKQMKKAFPLSNLSGSYITLKTIGSTTPAEEIVLHYDRGLFKYGRFEMGIISLMELKANAITVFGPLPQHLPIQVDEKRLKDFILRNLDSYWNKWIRDHHHIFRKKLLLILFPRMTEWSVLGMARQIYTLQCGEIISKTKAGEFALQQFPEAFRKIVKIAIDTRNDDHTIPLFKSYTIKPSLKRARQTIECLKYMLDQAKRN